MSKLIYTPSDLAIIKPFMMSAAATGIVPHDSVKSMLASLKSGSNEGSIVPQFLNVRDVMSRLRISKPTVYRLIKAKKLEFYFRK